MERELFEKVYIRSEADLPKEVNYYFVKYKDANIGVAHWHNNQDIWLSMYDWYLHPTELSVPKDGIKDSQNTELSGGQVNVGQVLGEKSICISCDELKYCSNICMDCIKKIVWENHQHSELSEVKESNLWQQNENGADNLKPAQSLTDEQIEKWAREYCIDNGYSLKQDIALVRDALKAMRDGKISEWLKNNG
jgi:hypothetical protein